MNRMLRLSAFFVVAAMLSSCSDSDSDSNNRGANRAPVVNAGSDITRGGGQRVDLVGLATDPDGDAVSYLWTQIAGPTVVIEQSNSPSAFFDAPQTDGATQILLRFQLTATDNSGANASDTVDVVILPPLSSFDPIIEEPIPSLRANEEEVVTLTASAFDPDGEIALYRWSFTDATPPLKVGETIELCEPIAEGDTSVPVCDATLPDEPNATPEIQFVAPDVDEPTLLTFRLIVEDDSDGPNTDTAETTVLVYPLPKPGRESQLYVVNGDAHIVRYLADDPNSPREFAADANFGNFNPGERGSDPELQIDSDIALTVDGRLIQADRLNLNGVQEVCAIAQRTRADDNSDGDNDGYAAQRDRSYTVSDDGGNTSSAGLTENYTGVAIDHERGYLIALDNFSGEGTRDARGIHVYGTAVNGIRNLVAEIPLGSNPQRVLYVARDPGGENPDDRDDTLFITTEDPATGQSHIEIFTDFIARVEQARVGRADAAVVGGDIQRNGLIRIALPNNPEQAVQNSRLRGIAYHRASDRLIVSDVGAASGSATTDGAVYVLSDVTAPSSEGFDRTIAADAIIGNGGAGDAPLSDPFDIALSGRDLLVSDPSNDRVYIYKDIFAVYNENRPELVGDAPIMIAGASYLAHQPLDTQYLNNFLTPRDQRDSDPDGSSGVLSADSLRPPLQHLNDLRQDLPEGDGLPDVDALLVLRNLADASAAEVLRVGVNEGADQDFDQGQLDMLQRLSFSRSEDVDNDDADEDLTASAMAVSINGDAYAVALAPAVPDSLPLPLPFGEAQPGVSAVKVLNSVARNRLAPNDSLAALSSIRDRAFNLTGPGPEPLETGAESAFSALSLDEFGVILVADGGGEFNAPGLSIHTLCGNGARLGERIITTDDGSQLTPSDMDYDGVRGDLYISFVDTGMPTQPVGKIGIIRNFDRYLESLIANPEDPDPLGTLLIVTPQIDPGSGVPQTAAPFGYTAIEYLPVIDQLVLATQGDPSVVEDGALHFVGDRRGAPLGTPASLIQSSTVEVEAVLTGPASLLGEPSDLAFDGYSLFVSDLETVTDGVPGSLLRFGNIGSLPSDLAGDPNTAPDARRGMPGAVAIVPLPDYVSGNPEVRLPEDVVPTADSR